MTNKRTLILTGTTSFNINAEKTDNSIEEVFDITLPSKQRYAKKYGYDFLAIRNFGKNDALQFKETDVGQLRAIRTFEMLSYYDVVVWIDADSLITNDNISIFDICSDTNHTFYASYDWYGKNYISTGNFIVQNTNYTNNFINLFYQIVKLFPEEQSTFNSIYLNSEFKNTMKVLEHKYLNAIPSLQMYAEQWEGRRQIVSPWTEDAFLVHITGIPNYARINILKKYFSKYL